MPFAILIFGIALLVSGFRGTSSQLFGLLKGEFTGTPSFGKWALAIAIIGGLGYIRSIRPITNSFLALVIIVLFLSNKGFFDKFQQQFGLTGTGV